MPKGYFFGEFEITDPVIYETYRLKVPDIISDHGGRIFVRGGDAQPLDGFLIVRPDATLFYANAQAVCEQR